MFNEEDKEFLDNPDFSMALEKYYDSAIYDTDTNNPSIEKVYPFSNEKQIACFDYLKEHLQGVGKKVLTVGSSGDQALTALYNGAKDITVVDANVYTKYYTDYKMAAIKNLSADDFHYYFVVMESPFCKDVFTKIFHDLDKDSQIFWGIIFMEEDDVLTRTAKGTPIKNKMWNDFYRMDEMKDSLFDHNEDGDYENYDKLQEILRKGDFSLKFINADFGKFPEVAKDKYDLILLSNVFDYVRDIDDCATFSRVVNKLYDDHLNDGGKMQILYAFGNDSFPSLWYLFDDNLFPNKHLVDFHLDDGSVNFVLHKNNLVNNIVFHHGQYQKDKNPYHIPSKNKTYKNIEKSEITQEERFARQKDDFSM